jgi:RimJ/RimL family protein N-acetyltransferase
MKNIAFRPVNDKDVDELFHMLKNLPDEGKKFFHPHSFDKKTLIQISASKNDYYFVLTLNNKIVGYSMLRFFGYATPSFGICIRKHYENRGFGSITTERTIQKASQLGYKVVILKVHEENSRAIKLFERCGFKIVQQNPFTREIKMKKNL